MGYREIMEQEVIMSFLCRLVMMMVLCVPWASVAEVTLFVAPDGSDAHAGTADEPFKSLERARDEIRALKARDGLPEGGIAVNILPGLYPVRGTFELTAEDSGSPTAPITYRAAGPEAPRFHGGVRLTEFALVEDEAVLARLPESARGKVWVADLAASGVEAPIPFERGGFGSGRGFQTYPAMELFVDGEPMNVARWPNEGFVKTGEVPGPLTVVGWDNRPGAEHGRFRFEHERLSRWADEPSGWLYGYWYWNWADSYERIERIDLEKQEISLAEPWHRYGYRENQRFYALNMLSELDATGEWYLDVENSRVYIYPKVDLNEAVVELSVAGERLMQVTGASHLRFEGIVWECGAADGVRIQGGEDCRLEGCTIRRMAGNGLEIAGGRGHVVRSCDIFSTGRGGIVLSGGDRKTLTSGEHLVENCHIHHLSRIDHTYTPGILLSGVGNQVRNNLIHNVLSSAMRVGGNDHLIERNEVHSVVLESDDQGAVDMWGDATYRGIVFRHNYWHHLGNWQGKGEHASSERAGIRLDDAISGVLIEGNVFHRACATPTWFGAVQIHGGKDNIIDGNLFVDCGAAVSFTPYGDNRWRDFIADALENPGIDKALYLERYPALAELGENHDSVLIRNNTIVRCDTEFLRKHAAVETDENREHSDSKAFQTVPGQRLTWSAAEAEAYGVADIPFESIGLYEDSWRTKDGSEWTLGIPRGD